MWDCCVQHRKATAALACADARTGRRVAGSARSLSSGTRPRQDVEHCRHSAAGAAVAVVCPVRARSLSPECTAFAVQLLETKYTALYGPVYMFTSIILPLRDATANGTVLTVAGESLLSRACTNIHAINTLRKRAALREMKQVLDQVHNLSVSVDGQRFVLSDFCLKPVPSGESCVERRRKRELIQSRARATHIVCVLTCIGACAVFSLLDFWRNDLAIVERDDDLTRTVSIRTEHPLGVSVPINSVLGGIRYDPDVRVSLSIDCSCRVSFFCFM